MHRDIGFARLGQPRLAKFALAAALKMPAAAHKAEPSALPTVRQAEPDELPQCAKP
jgi:hypothetical protein